jgi:hypothetical protein
MIYVDRNPVSRPVVLSSGKAKAMKREAGAYFIRESVHPSQIRFEFDPGIWADSELMAALRNLFKDKCAYCESPVGEGGVVDHYRPLAYASQLDGRTDAEYYWWLSFSWGNLYLSCPECNIAKRNLFPTLDPKNRCSLGAIGNRLHSEYPLLMDPCSFYPESDSG